MIATSTVVLLVRRAKYLGMIIIVATLQLLIIEYLVLASARAEPIGMEWLLSTLGVALLSPEMLILHFGAVLPGLALYFALTRGPRDPDASSNLRSALDVSGAQADYLWAAILAGLQGVALLVAIDPPLAQLIGKYLLLVVVFVLPTLIVAVLGIYFGIRYLRDFRRAGKRLWPLIRAYLKRLPHAVASLKQLPRAAIAELTETWLGWAMMVVTVIMFLIIFRYLEPDWQLIVWLLLRFVSGLGWAVIIGWTIFSTVMIIRALYWLYISLRRRIFPPGSFTPEHWKEIIRGQSPARQAETIVRTDHQSLGVAPDAFHEVLVDIAKDVRAEPALSVYWQHRAELEQVLKQERQG